MADRVGKENAVFKIKLSNGQEYIKNLPIHNQEEAVKLLIEDLKKFHVVEDLREISGVGHRVVMEEKFSKNQSMLKKRNYKKYLILENWHRCIIFQKQMVLRHL